MCIYLERSSAGCRCMVLFEFLVELVPGRARVPRDSIGNSQREPRRGFFIFFFPFFLWEVDLMLGCAYRFHRSATLQRGCGWCNMLHALYKYQCVKHNNHA